MENVNFGMMGSTNAPDTIGGCRLLYCYQKPETFRHPRLCETRQCQSLFGEKLGSFFCRGTSMLIRFLFLVASWKERPSKLGLRVSLTRRDVVDVLDQDVVEADAGQGVLSGAAVEVVVHVPIFLGHLHAAAATDDALKRRGLRGNSGKSL